jgi:hypothetical protein
MGGIMYEVKIVTVTPNGQDVNVVKRLENMAQATIVLNWIMGDYQDKGYVVQTSGRSHHYDFYERKVDTLVYAGTIGIVEVDSAILEASQKNI